MTLSVALFVFTSFAAAETASADAVSCVNAFDASLDIDGNGREDALTDGMLLLRYLFGIRGDVLIDNAVAADAAHSTATELEPRLESARNGFVDVDGDGEQDALTDGLLWLRYLFGFRGDALVSGAVSSSATRFEAADIEACIALFIHTPAPRAIVWQDDFNSVDPTSWSFEVGGQGWGNQELEYYTDGDNAFIEFDESVNSNVLVLEARQENDADYQCWYGRCTYTSTRLVSLGKREFTYGRVEARIKLPQTQGIWPAFWMLGNDFPTVGWPFSGEIDIMEHVGFEPNTTHGAMHGPGYSGATPIFGTLTLPEPVDSGYHVYAVEWKSDSIRWYVDDTQFYSVTREEVERFGPWVADHPFFLLLNVAVGGTWPGQPDAGSRFPQRMSIDYVRVYEADDSIDPPDPEPPQVEPVAIPGTVQAEDYADYFDTTPGNTGNSYRFDDVDIEATSYPGGGFNVGWIQPGEWLEYRITVAEPGLFDVSVPNASAVGGGSFHLDIDGVPSGPVVHVNGTGGWQSWQVATVTELAIDAGEHVVRLTFDSGEFNIDSLTFTRSP